MAERNKAVAQRETAANTEMVISQETRDMFAQMVVAVPESDGSGTERILLAILGAKSWEELDDPWDSTKSDELVGVELAIHSITRHVSTYTDGLGVFLVAHCKRLDDNTETVFSTGSVSVVGQLVRAFMLGAFPLYAILRKSDKPTSKGYYPMHLEVMASGSGPAVAS